ncbi:camelysin-like metallo-endopeptidase [Halopolyspora algeriensis]|uniref:Camelysin-like metallo-endopeptidase n=1 Tax=Halopolyspora algeriensis TaxID=1500506 RepID=A0A368VYF3_9ACTN|nr:TasA family protein [Halopolyspora algeriensis]RCW45267.1 camelysin-like metallo-endopeptidase [Halopolyspora algeriensis]TQM53014.1 camelysin-like metallo-endopeptidase [Halopolyspora algeriensis]
MRNKKLAAGIGGASAVTAVVAITAGTYALLSDEEERGAVATAGTMDLQVGNLNSTEGSSFNENGALEVGPLHPGDSSSASFTLTNEGSVAGNLSFRLEKDADDENELTEPERDAGDDSEGKNEGELFENLRITGLAAENEKLTEVVGEPRSAGTLGPGESRTFTVNLTVPQNATSVIQNDSAGFQIVADLNQR